MQVLTKDEMHYYGRYSHFYECIQNNKILKIQTISKISNDEVK